MPAELDRNCQEPAYLYGRIFACMVYAQERAQPTINSGFLSMMGAVMRSPGSVIARLEPKSVSHIERMRRMAQRLDQEGASEKDRALAWSAHRKVNSERTEAIGMLGGDGIKMTLTPREQGIFMVGYHLQRAAFFLASEKTKTGAENLPEAPASPTRVAA